MKDIDEAIRERQAIIVKLQEEVAALKRVRPILTGKTTGVQLALMSAATTDRRKKTRPDSDASLGALAIRDAGKPLSITDVMASITKKGKKTKKSSVISTMAKMAKKGQVFYRCIQPNTFGLLEWEERPDIRSA